MKKLKLLLLLLLPLLSACKENCEGIDCLSDVAFAFTIKSEASGKNLLFGADATLTQEDVEVYHLVNGTKQPAFVRFESNYVLVGLQPQVKEYFVSALDRTDAVQIDARQNPSSECCPSTTSIEQLTVNGTVLNEDTWVIELTR